MNKFLKGTGQKFFITIFLMLFALCLSQAAMFFINTKASFSVCLLTGAFFELILIFWYKSIFKRTTNISIKRLIASTVFLMAAWILLKTLNLAGEKFYKLQPLFFLYCFFVPAIMFVSFFMFFLFSLNSAKKNKTIYCTFLTHFSCFFFIFAIIANKIICTFCKNQNIFSGSSVYSKKAAFLLLASFFICFAIIAIIRCIHRQYTIFPVILIFLAMIYICLYVFNCSFLKNIFLNDFTVNICIFYIFIIETCMQTGLIQTNSHYDELFEASTAKVQIVDNFYRRYLASMQVETVQPKVLRRTETSPLVLNNGIRLSGAAIPGGHVIWQEDISELQTVLTNLKDAEESLQGENRILQQNYETQKHIQKLAEQNRLYDEIHRQTAPEIDKLAQLIKSFKQQKNAEKKRQILCRMLMLGAYLKRRSNLIFIGQQSGTIEARDLELCFEEMMENLKLIGINTGCFVNCGEKLSMWAATSIFDFYEYVIETSFNCLSAIMVRVYKSNSSLFVCIEAAAAKDLKEILDKNITIQVDEDGIFQIFLKLQGGAE